MRLLRVLIQEWQSSLTISCGCATAVPCSASANPNASLCIIIYSAHIDRRISRYVTYTERYGYTGSGLRDIDHTRECLPCTPTHKLATINCYFAAILRTSDNSRTKRGDAAIIVYVLCVCPVKIRKLSYVIHNNNTHTLLSW